MAFGDLGATRFLFSTILCSSFDQYSNISRLDRREPPGYGEVPLQATSQDESTTMEYANKHKEIWRNSSIFGLQHPVDVSVCPMEMSHWSRGHSVQCADLNRSQVGTSRMSLRLASTSSLEHFRGKPTINFRDVYVVYQFFFSLLNLRDKCNIHIGGQWGLPSDKFQKYSKQRQVRYSSLLLV